VEVLVNALECNIIYTVLKRSAKWQEG